MHLLEKIEVNGQVFREIKALNERPPVAEGYIVKELISSSRYTYCDNECLENMADTEQSLLAGCTSNHYIFSKYSPES
jgi:hypothetical protein